MSNIVTIVRNANDTQVEINGREIIDVVTVEELVNVLTGEGIVTLTFKAAQVNIIGVNAKRDPAFVSCADRPKPSRWQRIKSAFERWQNAKYPDNDY